jgi:ADP-ribose pyrophosphatase YjhB (NUDIX family)
MIQVHSAVNMIILDSYNRILLVKRSSEKKIFPSHWSIPGGHVEIGETIEVALEREILEELSVKITNRTYFKSFYVKQNDNIHVRGFYFYGSIDGNVKINEEASEWKWFSWDEINNEKLELAFNQNAILNDFKLCHPDLFSKRP